MMKKALVVFSGGQDSTTCLTWALQKYDHVETITFDYGQRHHKEVEIAQHIAKDFDVKNSVLDMSLLSQMTTNALTKDIQIKQGEKMPNTYVEGRNLLFISFAAIVAKARGMHDVIIGVSETDFSGYPDCRNDFIKSLNVTLNLAMDYNFELITPLMWLDKKQVWELSDHLGSFDYIREQTLTCYNGVIGKGCGTCPSCQLRNDSLQAYLQERDG
ncbi:MAG TPA: 7-cyano-7-deazaguanine synthase QueC [Bacillota bacterium]|nr:7-cyano-7-deazaguanine synthase QueC [Bacillota bacterium]